MEAYRRLLKKYPESGLREYIYYKAVQSAVEQEDRSRAQEWVRGYREEFGQAQYWTEIKSRLQDAFGMDADTLTSDSLLEKE
jgi:hypothetical protein